MLQQIKDNQSELIALCKSHSVKAIYLFGSAASGNAHSKSDIDLLVHFSNDLDILKYADNYFSLLENLEKLLGKKVDLVSIKSLKNPILIQEIDRTKVELYAA